jgi:hypothetical protein
MTAAKGGLHATYDPLDPHQLAPAKSLAAEACCPFSPTFSGYHNQRSLACAILCDAFPCRNKGRVDQIPLHIINHSHQEGYPDRMLTLYPSLPATSTLVFAGTLPLVPEKVHP